MIKSLYNKVAHGELARDIVWLYVIYFLNYLVPLLMIPYLARVLGAKGWGIVAFALSFAGFVSLVTEYGFYISGQREAARCRHDGPALSRLFVEVLCAKLLVAPVVIAASVMVSRFVPILDDDPRLLAGALFLAAIQGLSVGWFFRGIQRIRLAAGMEAAAKGAGVVLVVLFVDSPSDSWKYFYALGASQLVVLLYGFWLVASEIGLYFPRMADGLKALHRGRSIFLVHAAGSVFTTSNAFILGLLAPPQAVGYFAGAERIVRFLANAMDPVRHALFPRMSYLVQGNREEARRQVMLVLVVTGVISALLGCALYFTAPFLVPLILGQHFVPAIICVQALAILIPVLTFNSGLGFLWLLPRGFDGASASILLLALATNIVLASQSVPIWQELGMAASVVISESLIVLGFFIYFLRDKNAKPV